AIGHPVVGDAVYGGARASLRADRPFLHADRLELEHPLDGRHLVFNSPLPEDLAALLGRCH
ncbi:MAG: RluA family pseudouridine synthase, partial [Actinomycetota bacterium]